MTVTVPLALLRVLAVLAGDADEDAGDAGIASEDVGWRCWLARMLAGDVGWRGCWLVMLAMMLVMLAGDDGEDAGDAGWR